MNNQLRILTVSLGALLVLATFTFPQWQPYLNLLPTGSGVILPCLPPQANEPFLTLAEETRTALLTLAEEDADIACGLILAHLANDNPVPPAQQELPEDLIGQIQIGFGTIVPAIDSVDAEGAISIFELADGRLLLRFDDFAVTNVPDLEIWFSGNPAPTTEEEMQQGGNYQFIDNLLGNIGNQNYLIAADIDLSRYNSVVIFSNELRLVVGYAQYITF